MATYTELKTIREDKNIENKILRLEQVNKEELKKVIKETEKTEVLTQIIFDLIDLNNYKYKQAEKFEIMEIILNNKNINNFIINIIYKFLINSRVKNAESENYDRLIYAYIINKKRNINKIKELAEIFKKLLLVKNSMVNYSILLELTKFKEIDSETLKELERRKENLRYFFNIIKKEEKQKTEKEIKKEEKEREQEIKEIKKFFKFK